MTEHETRLAQQREEISRLTKHIENLTQSRDYWKDKAEKLAKKLKIMRKERSENGKS